jgi:hypothetical protein
MTEFLLRRTLARSKPILVRELSSMITGQESLMVAAQVPLPRLLLYYLPYFFPPFSYLLPPKF